MARTAKSGERDAMSTGVDAGNPEPGGLQFDRAEFDQAAPAAVACAACKRPIEGDYYEINGTVVCEPCRDAIEGQLRGGSGFARFLRASAFGTIAAAVGALAYAVFIWASGLDFALVSILVGYLVGRAVRAGSRNRGGLTYQILAVVLTYLAVGVTYAAVELSQEDPADLLALRSNPLILARSFLRATVESPVLQVRHSVISIAIIGFALWQAWKMNQRLRLVVTGPYRVGEGTREDPAEGAASHA